jgi:hypothetical protein
MPADLNNPRPAFVVHQLCGAPDVLVGVSVLASSLAPYVHAIWVLGLLWTCLVAPGLWARYRMRLEQAGLGLRPIPCAHVLVPLLIAAGLLLALATFALAWFEGPIPEHLQGHPAVTSAYGWILGLTGLLVALSLRWARWAGYALVQLAGTATLFLGAPEGLPEAVTGLLMIGCGLYSFLRYTRRHPELLGGQPLRASR